MFKYAIPTLLLLTICACSDATEEESIQILESSYYPLDEGNYQVYNVQDIAIYDNGKVRDTSIFQLREEVIEAYVSEENHKVFIIDQFIRINQNSNWIYDKRLTVQFIENQIVRTEDNIALTKLSLPIQNNNNWNPTSFFNSEISILIGTDEIDYYKNWEAKILSTNGEIEINGKNYNNVVSTQFVSYENRLEYGFGIESYADNIGLISQTIEIFRTQCFDSCQNVDWDDKVETGHIYNKEIVESSNG